MPGDITVMTAVFLISRPIDLERLGHSCRPLVPGRGTADLVAVAVLGHLGTVANAPPIFQIERLFLEPEVLKLQRVVRSQLNGAGVADRNVVEQAPATVAVRRGDDGAVDFHISYDLGTRGPVGVPFNLPPEQTVRLALASTPANATRKQRFTVAPL